MMSEQITLTGIAEFGRHGVYPQEKQNKQKFVVDLKINLARLSYEDKIETTVDYAELASSIRDVIADNEFDLLETLAAAIAVKCLENVLIDSVTVTVHKPEAAVSLGLSDLTVSLAKTR